MNSVLGSVLAMFSYTITKPEERQAELLAALETYGIAQELSTPVRYRLGLIVDELVANCIAHGVGPGEHACIEVHISHDAQNIFLHFADNGPEFDPTTPADQAHQTDPLRIGGMGLKLIRHFSSHLAYTRQENRNHIHITLPTCIQENECTLTM